MPTPSDTTFFRRSSRSLSQFILATEEDSRPRAVHGALILGIARARGIPSRMPCCTDHGLVPADATIVLTDLSLSTWGGAVKAAGDISLFRSPVAQDFWSLVSYVDSFGDMAMENWKRTETVTRYKAAADWWALHRPVWDGKGEMEVISTILALVYILTVLLGDEAELRAYAERTDGKVERLRRDQQSLLRTSKEKVELKTEVFFIEGVEEMAGSGVGNGTGLFRR